MVLASGPSIPPGKMVSPALTLFTLYFVFRTVSAQSDASCLPFYSWTFNSQKQTPCTVASSLLAVCNGGPYPVAALPDSSHYVGPTLANANPCQCNTVTYSLMSACGACQGKTFISWSEWSTNCATVSISTLPEPIPSGLHVPGWAYLDVKSSDNFNQILARANANVTESTAVPPPTAKPTSVIPSTHADTITSSSISPAPSTSVQTTPTSDASSSAAIIDAHANLVGGAVVGSIFGAMLLFALLYYVHSRRKGNRSLNSEMIQTAGQPAQRWSIPDQHLASSVPPNNEQRTGFSTEADPFRNSGPTNSHTTDNTNNVRQRDSISDPQFQV